MREQSEKGHRGFSMIELTLVMVVGLIIAAMAIPAFLTIEHNLRISGDAREIHGDMAVAKMRAASDFTRARLYADLAANTFRIELWNKSGAGSWVTEGGTQPLSQGVSLGFGALGTPPPGTQAPIGQASACLDNAGAAIPNTACIVFNSRGIPVDSTGAPAPNGAIYITDGVAVYGITVSATALMQAWRSAAGAAAWKKI